MISIVDLDFVQFPSHRFCTAYTSDVEPAVLGSYVAQEGIEDMVLAKIRLGRAAAEIADLFTAPRMDVDSIIKIFGCSVVEPSIPIFFP